MIKPKKLSKGDKVAIVSLSSGLMGEEFSKHQLPLGIKRLEEFGLVPVFMPNSLKGIEYLNQHPEARAQDLKDAFFDESIKGIICAIGGDDTYRLLPYLMEDETFTNTVKQSPKLFSGYSDTTINHLMFFKLGMTSFYGPNFICDLAEMGDEMLPYTKESFMRYFDNSPNYEILSSDLWYEERTDFSDASVGRDRISHKEERGYEVLQGEGKVRGELLGGCLESLYDILKGTRHSDERETCEKYGIFPEKEIWKDKILFIETCEEKPEPELFRKELMALKERGVFEAISGIVVGKPQDEAYYEEYKPILVDVVGNKNLPILYNVNFGHAHPKCILPYGAMAELDLDNKKITIIESMFD